MASTPEHAYEMQLYYEDTDFTGAVYHGNYLRYFERARDDLIGIDLLKTALGDQDRGATLHVHKVENLTFRGAAKHADVLVVMTRVAKLSDFRLSFSQSAYVKSAAPAATGPEADAKPIVEGTTVVVFLDNATQALVKVPLQVLGSITQFTR